jgi:flavin-binding protein dodecin
MTQHVYKVVEIVGTSETSLSDAIERGVTKASESVHHMGWFEVTKISGHLENGKIGHYQVSLKLGFRVDES